MISPDEFLYYVKNSDHPNAFKLGAIDTDYTSGLPRVQFDGEAETSIRTYTHLDTYTPAADDRVLLARVGHTYVIVGAIGGPTYTTGTTAPDNPEVGAVWFDTSGS